VGLANLGSESETCVGSRVHLVGVSISFEKNFYQLPFTPPSLVRRIGPSALRWRGETVHGLPSVVLVLVCIGWFPRSGFRGGVRGGSFGRKDVLDCANPTFEQMALHWFHSFGTNPVLSRLFTHVLVFEF
jgi:hypothetical protein